MQPDREKQLGVFDKAMETESEGIKVYEEAAAKARGAGLLVVMDKCMFKEHQRLIQEQNN